MSYEQKFSNRFLCSCIIGGTLVISSVALGIATLAAMCLQLDKKSLEIQTYVYRFLATVAILSTGIMICLPLPEEVKFSFYAILTSALALITACLSACYITLNLKVLGALYAANTIFMICFTIWSGYIHTLKVREMEALRKRQAVVLPRIIITGPDSSPRRENITRADNEKSRR